MKIAIVSSPYLPVPPKKYGGTERIVEFLTHGLLELGHEPILLAPGDSEIDCEIIPICEKALYFPKNKEEKVIMQPIFDAAIEKTRQELGKLTERVDIIHSHGFDLEEFQNFPNLTTLHNRIDLPEISYFLERKGLYYASISKNQQETFPDLQYVGAVYNGLDPEPFTFVEEPEDYLCFLGRFDRDKLPHLAMQMAITLGKKIKLAGKIDYVGNEYFERECKPLFDHPLVEYLGELGMEEKVELISKAKCNLHPTGFREPFGLSVLEAAYCGTPTMAIDRGSMPELIEHERTGILVEDFAEGYHLINKCYEMDRGYISQRAKRLFNYKIMAKQYVMAYEKVTEIFKKKHHEDEAEKAKILQETKGQLKGYWKGVTQK